MIRKINQGHYEEKSFLDGLAEILLLTRKVLNLSKLITVSDLNFQYEQHEGDLIEFIIEYLKEINPLHSNEIHIKYERMPGARYLSFSILGLSVLIDNMVSNAVKAGAKNILFKMESVEPLRLLVSDDGSGVTDEIENHIFDIGFTTSRGSGIGLANAKDILKELNGNIKFLGNGILLKGACFELSI